MPLLRTFAYAALLAPMLACSLEKANADEDFTDLAGLDSKSDYFSYRLKLLGTLSDGAEVTARYTKTPRFRGYDFTAAAGDPVDVWVRSNTGDAIAWVLDGKFRVVAKNDDADDTTYDAHLVATLPASGTSDSRYYVVFRDYNTASRNFTVSFHAAGAGGDLTWESEARDKVHELVLNDSQLPPFAVPLASMPQAAREREAVSHAALEVPTTYKVDVDGRPVWLVMDTDGSGEGNVVVVDLVDGAGRWFAHGIAHGIWDGNSGMSFDLDDSDPTMCRCVGAKGVCTWMDGTTSTSTQLTCP